MSMFQHTHPKFGLLPINISEEMVRANDDQHLMGNIHIYREMTKRFPQLAGEEDISGNYLRLLESVAAERGIEI